MTAGRQDAPDAWSRELHVVTSATATARRRTIPADPDAEREFAELLAAGKRGEPAAFPVLYHRLAGPVASYLRARGVRDVEDIVSDVFLSVFTGLGKFRGGEADLRAWVLTIAHHRWVDAQRRNGRRVDTTDYDPATDPRRSHSAEDDGMARLATQRVHDRLARLSPEQREVLVLRLVDDLTIERVAGILNKRVGAVKALQRRGLAVLRQIVDEEDGVPL